MKHLQYIDKCHHNYNFISCQKILILNVTFFFLQAVGKLPEAKHYQSQISWVYPDGTVVIGLFDLIVEGLNMKIFFQTKCIFSTVIIIFWPLLSLQRVRRHTADLSQHQSRL